MIALHYVFFAAKRMDASIAVCITAVVLYQVVPVSRA